MRSRGRSMEMAMVLLVVSALCLPGCGKKYDPVPSPKTKINPSPQEKYMVSVYAKDGIPDEARVRVWYEISNRKCIPLDYGRALGGVRLDYAVRLDLNPVHVSENELRVEIAQDKILPDDYWGLGVCNWEVQDVAIYFGNWHHEARMSGDEIRGEDKVFWGCRRTSSSVGGFDCIQLAGKMVERKYGFSGVRRVNSFHGSVFILKSKDIGK